MKRCPRCAEKIQDRASVCRFCGAAQPEQRGGAGTLLLVIGGAVVLVAVGSSITGTKDEKSSSASAAEAPKPATHSPKGTDPHTVAPSSKYSDVGKQYAWIETGEEQIKTKLKDPDSAKFRNVHFYSGGGVPVICGEVNAKNSFGGYDGFERFIAAGSQLAVLESDMTSPSELDPVWQRFCSRASTDEA